MNNEIKNEAKVETKVETKAETKVEAKGKGSKRFLIGLILSLVLAGGAGIGLYFVWQGAGYLTTDNARVTTNLITLSSGMPGQLERFMAYEGRYVAENDVLGWVSGGEALRSPVNGLVIYTNAVQDQAVSPMEPLAVIADTGGIHIQANIEETDIIRLQIGQPATVTIDGLGNRQFNGYISEIGRITQAELTGNPLFFNTGGTFTRVTHLIPIKINIIDDINLDSLLGVNARVSIPLRDFEPVQIQPANHLNLTSWGVVESARSRNVYSVTAGRIETVSVEVGDFVSEGQVLAAIETEDLLLAIAQHRASLETARQAGQTAIEDTQRMFGEASANLANNANIHVLSAEAALEAAAINLAAIQRNYNDALRDYTEGTNPQILSAESFLRSATTEFETRERDYANARSLYTGGILSQHEMRQAENALTFARNQYNDARTGYNNAREFQQRNLDQLRIALQGATASHQQARELANASRIAAAQEINMLRSHVSATEIAADLESMEIALMILERQLEESMITAPISGTVTQVFAREGEIGMGRLFAIEDTNNLRIITSFREYDLAMLAEGMEVVITSTGTGSAEYTGVISRINPAAMPFSPVVEFEAEVAVVSADTGLRIGMTVRLGVGM